MKETMKRSHHSDRSSRPRRVEVMFTDEEMKVVEYRWKMIRKDTKMPRSEYIRRMALTGSVCQAVSSQDRKDISRLVNIGTSLWNLRKQAHNEGLYGMETQFKDFAEEFEQIIEYYQEKLQQR